MTKMKTRNGNVAPAAAIKAYLIHAIQASKAWDEYDEFENTDSVDPETLLRAQLVYIYEDILDVGSGTDTYYLLRPFKGKSVPHILEGKAGPLLISRVYPASVLRDKNLGKAATDYLQGISSLVPIAFDTHSSVELMVKWGRAKPEVLEDEGDEWSDAGDQYWIEVGNTLAMLADRARRGLSLKPEMNLAEVMYGQKGVNNA